MWMMSGRSGIFSRNRASLRLGGDKRNRYWRRSSLACSAKFEGTNRYAFFSEVPLTTSQRAGEPSGKVRVAAHSRVDLSIFVPSLNCSVRFWSKWKTTGARQNGLRDLAHFSCALNWLLTCSSVMTLNAYRGEKVRYAFPSIRPRKVDRVPSRDFHHTEQLSGEPSDPLESS